jgi:hypothetical protein
MTKKYVFNRWFTLDRGYGSHKQERGPIGTALLELMKETIQQAFPFIVPSLQSDQPKKNTANAPWAN